MAFERLPLGSQPDIASAHGRLGCAAYGNTSGFRNALKHTTKLRTNRTSFIAIGRYSKEVSILSASQRRFCLFASNVESTSTLLHMRHPTSPSPLRPSGRVSAPRGWLTFTVQTTLTAGWGKVTRAQAWLVEPHAPIGYREEVRGCCGRRVLRT